MSPARQRALGVFPWGVRPLVSEGAAHSQQERIPPPDHCCRGRAFPFPFPFPSFHLAPPPLSLISAFPSPSGFGFVTFRDDACCHEVLRKRPHIIDAREVDPKMAVPREEMDTGPRGPHHSVGRDGRRQAPRGAMHSQVRGATLSPPRDWAGSADQARVLWAVSRLARRRLRSPSTPRFSFPSLLRQTRKVFVGGLPSSATDDALRTFFSSYGQVCVPLDAPDGCCCPSFSWLPTHARPRPFLPPQVEEAVVIHDKQTRLPRGFGFITFLDEMAADQVVNIHYHEFLGKMVSHSAAVACGLGAQALSDAPQRFVPCTHDGATA